MASALVRVTAEGGKSRVLWRGLLGADWVQQVISLEPYAGSVIKLEFSALGEGVVGFASPSLLQPTSPLTAAPAPARSVIVLLIDTLRADHLRAYDKTTPVRTPALDEFAEHATLFEAAQAPENWTKPSVASVLTGLYPLSHGTKTGDARLSERAIVLSEAFKDSGFTTAAFLANGFVSERFGFNQGWDDYINYVHEKRNSKADYVFRDAAKWVELHRAERFFLYIQTADPHVPYDPPSEYISLYDKAPYNGPIKPRFTADQLEKAKVVPPKLVFNDRDRQYLEALYDGEISFHDHYLGLFIDRLKELGVYDEVMFVITADHGEEFYDHGSYGHGHTVYQELLHVPLLARLPGQSKPKRITETVSTIDIAPSVLRGAGLVVPDEMEGIDRMPQLRGAQAPIPAVAFSDFLDDRHAIRAGRWKLILRALTPTLFDLESDPHETRELDPKAHPIAMRYCRTLLGQFLGTRDRGDWLTAAPKGRSVELKGGAADIDETTRAGLRALGYAN
jgi:choline-sulfatase